MIHTYWWWRWYKLSHAASRRIPRAPQQFNGMPVITSDAGADLSYAMLDGASLRGAILWAVRARGADFSEADLDGVQLGAADLGGAILRGANLRNASLMGTTLRDADLRGANLTGTAPDPALSQGAMRDP